MYSVRTGTIWPAPRYLRSDEIAGAETELAREEEEAGDCQGGRQPPEDRDDEPPLCRSLCTENGVYIRYMTHTNAGGSDFGISGPSDLIGQRDSSLQRLREHPQRH